MERGGLPFTLASPGRALQGTNLRILPRSKYAGP